MPKARLHVINNSNPSEAVKVYMSAAYYNYCDYAVYDRPVGGTSIGQVHFAHEGAGGYYYIISNTQRSFWVEVTHSEIEDAPAPGQPNAITLGPGNRSQEVMFAYGDPQNDAKITMQLGSFQ